jgi:putative ABC transport system substrate-binding protein
MISRQLSPLPLVVTAMLAVTVLTSAVAAQSPSGAKVRLIGFLGFNIPALAHDHVGAFRSGLRERGWIDGQNIAIEFRWAEGRYERLTDMATELARSRVEVIVASGAPAVLAAKRATSTIPIVMAQISDPVALGVIESLPKPGGNVTGIANLHAELAPKQLELLREAVAPLSRVGILVSPQNPAADLVRRHAKHAMAKLGVAVQTVDVTDTRTIERAIVTLKRDRIDAVLVPGDPFFLPYTQQIVDLTLQHRLPAMYGSRDIVEMGGLIAYGPNVPELFRGAALYVDRILKGARPADLPIEQPTHFELVINVKTATALGIMLPESLLLRADSLIQ